MSQLSAMLNQLDPVVHAGIRRKINAINIENIIIKHAIASAAAGLAGGFLPGVAGIIAVVTSAGAIWTMYYRICREMGIKISQSILKTLGSAILSNIVTQLGGVILIEAIASFIPGVAIVASAAACYGVVYLAGYLFIKLLVSVFKAGQDPSVMSADELSAAGRQAAAEADCKTIFQEARAEAKSKIRSGEISKEEAQVS